jgi:hypothetical protein
MARDWINRNNNAGNVLKMQGITIDAEDTEGGFEGTPNANIAIVNLINVAAGSSTLDVDASKSLIGDEIKLLVETNGTADITLGGDFAAGVINIVGAGVGAYSFLFNGTSFFATATPE